MHPWRALALFVVLIGLALLPNALRAQCDEGTALAAPTPTPSAFLGFGVATDGELSVAGAFGDSELGTSAGAVYPYRRSGNNWLPEAKIVAVDGAAGDLFGTRVAVQAPWLAIGAPGESEAGNDSGAVYLYQRVGTEWQFHTKIRPFDGVSGDRFGDAVSLDGDTLVVGAPERDELGGAAGAVYVYRFDGTLWNQENKILPLTLEVADRFGFAVAVNGDLAMIGAIGDDDGGVNAGAVYVYERLTPTWFQIDKLIPADVVSEDRFGSAVDFDNGAAMIGSPSDDDFIFNSGAAYAFTEVAGVWTEEAKIYPSDIAISDLFGFAIAVGGNYAVVSSPLDDDNGTSSGGAYIFERIGGAWVEIDKVIAPDGEDMDNFGQGVDVGGGIVAVGAWQHTTTVDAAGSLYLFRAVPLDDCDGNGIDDSCELAAGTATDCNCNGIIDACDIAAGTSLDVNGDDIPDECGVDCDNDGVSDTCQIATGFGFDCNANGILDSCEITAGMETDCNNNGRLDSCDIGVTTILDCNGNLIDDPCEIVMGTCSDCNRNGIPDDCDITVGTSLDLDVDTIPDECQLDYVRGDSNVDGMIGLSDPLLTATYLFISGGTNPPPCLAALDANADGEIDISDPLYLLIFLFIGGNAPPAPFPGCGVNGAADCFPCVTNPQC